MADETYTAHPALPTDELWGLFCRERDALPADAPLDEAAEAIAERVFERYSIDDTTAAALTITGLKARVLDAFAWHNAAEAKAFEADKSAERNPQRSATAGIIDALRAHGSPFADKRSAERVSRGSSTICRRSTPPSG
jgi:hypothetical protein